MHFLSENETVSQRLRTLLQETGCNGKRVHDANIVAIALTHHIAKLVTANPRDFTAFQHHIAVLELQTS
jgi:predicted nucleic acid-binding protein